MSPRRQRAQEFGRRLKALRIAKGFTNASLSQALNDDPAHISRWEHGRGLPNFASLLLLSDTLSCSIDYLVRGREFGQ